MSDHYPNTISPDRVATLSLLNGSDGVLGNRGEELLAAKAYANGTAENAKLDALAASQMAQNDQIRDLLRDRQFTDMQLQISDAKTEAVRIAGDNRVELQTKVDSVLAKVAECCCETQKEILRESNTTRELINERALASANRALDTAERSSGTDKVIAAMQAQTSQFIQALSSVHGHGGR